MNIYGFCDNNCKHLVYTREEVLSLLRQAVEDGSLNGVDPEFAAVKKVLDINGGANITFWTGTEAEYNALDPAPDARYVIPRVTDDGVIYICVDGAGMALLPTEAITSAEIDEICV